MKDELTMPVNRIRPKGRARIELFNTDGEMVQRTEKDNYVDQSILQTLADFATLNAVGPKIYEMPLLKLNNGIVLTDYSEDIPPENNKTIRGNPIGWAFYEEVRSTEKIGGYNASESVISSNYVKMVFDFPTSAANGTFNSIYTGPIQYYVDTAFSLQSGILAYLSSVPEKYGVRDLYRATDRIMYLKDTQLEVFKSLPILGNMSSGSVSGGNTVERIFKDAPKEVYTIPTGYKTVAFSIVTRKYYYTMNSKKIYSAPESDPTNITLEADLTTALAPVNSYSYTYGMTIDPSGEHLYMQCYTSGIAKVRISDWSLLTLLPVGNTTTYSLAFAPEDPNILYLNGYANLYAYDVAENRKIYTSRTQEVKSTEGFLPLSGGLAYVGYNHTSSSYLKQALMIVPRMFSRVLLDAPVTKTSQNSMKITYEFILPEFDLLDR